MTSDRKCHFLLVYYAAWIVRGLVEKHNIKLHVKKLGCGTCKCTQSTYTCVQVKLWSDLPSEILVIHVADKQGLGCKGVWLDFNICSCHLEKKKNVCYNAIIINLKIINITLLTAWGSPSDWNSQCLAFTCSTFKYKGNICYTWPSAWSFHFTFQQSNTTFQKSGLARQIIKVINLTEFPVWPSHTIRILWEQCIPYS